MPDAIPGAVYTDHSRGVQLVCNGIVESGEIHKVVVEYDDANESLRIPLHLFKDSDVIELDELP